MDNEEVRTEFDQICTWLQEDISSPETNPHDSEHLALVLAQDDFSMMGLSSPTEQVAYLLREKTTLQEDLKAAERQLERQNFTGNFREVRQHDNMMGEELRQQTEDMLKSIDDMTKAYYEELSQERNERQRLEQDLEEVSGKLLMAQHDIHRLTSERDAAKHNLCPGESELRKTMEDLDDMMKELTKLKVSDAIKLHQAKEENARLDAENKDLRERMSTLESERKTLLEQLAVGDAGRDVVADESISGEPLNSLCVMSAPEMDQERKLEINDLNEQLSSTNQTLSKSDMPDPCKAHEESGLSPVEGNWAKRLDRHTCLQQELNDLQTKLGQAEQLASQNQLDLNKLALGFTILQSQASEFQACISFQELEVRQKLEETKQMKQDLSRTRDENLNHFTFLKLNVKKLENKLCEEQQVASKNQMIFEAQINEAQAHIKSQDLELNQKAEEAVEMKQGLQRTQSLLTSAERELHTENEKSMDLKRHITVLEQENFKLCEQLKQAQTKLTQVEQSVNNQADELEHSKQTIRDLQLELARNSTNASAAADLQKALQAERARLTEADKKALELEQQLKSVQQQLRVEEARAGESNCTERDIKQLSDILSAMRSRKQQEDMIRKLLEQRKLELQQQVCSLVLTEAALNRTNARLSNRAHQLNTHLAILQTELNQARRDSKNSQNSINTLQDELEDSQQECGRLHKELQQVLLQLDLNARKKYQAKQVLLKEMAKRDQTIQKLENDLVLALVLSQKEKERVSAVMEVNEKLLQEKRELLRKISKAEEIASKSAINAATAHHRVSLLDVENRQLQDRILKLSNQVSPLKSFCGLENPEKVLPPVSDYRNLQRGEGERS